MQEAVCPFPITIAFFRQSLNFPLWGVRETALPPPRTRHRLPVTRLVVARRQGRSPARREEGRAHTETRNTARRCCSAVRPRGRSPRQRVTLETRSGSDP